MLNTLSHHVNGSTVSARTRDEQKQATRARLLRVARRVFARHGFDRTSVAMVCGAARVTHGALYHHFASKTELFAAVVEQLFADIGERVRRAVEGAAGWGQVEAACDAYLDACADGDTQVILFRDGPRVLPRARFDAIDHGENAPLVVGLLEAWMAAGLLRPLPAELVARVLGAAFAEAGAVITDATSPAAARAEVGALLRGWIEALRPR
jgi:AcrR family transcriptional regulator